MKRLKNYLLGMEPNSTTYKEIYEGEMVIPAGVNTEYHYDSTYWNEGISYRYERTNKFELDKPTITIQIPIERLGVRACNTASADYILRSFKFYIDKLNEDNYNRKRQDKENGMYYLYHPNGKVLLRNTAYFKHVNQKYYNLIKGNIISAPDDMTEIPSIQCICLMLQVQLPYKKLRKTIQMLTKDLPDMVEKFVADFDLNELEKATQLYQKQEDIRVWLHHSEYCAFIANGSILPRLKGTDLPLVSAIPFQSNKEDEIEIYGVKGMGIKRGVTVITGGGYSGKSTLLDAINAGVYHHRAGDGREFVITDQTAIKVSAEDGRSIKNVNISPFIKWIPNGDACNFSTEHASGSTSQAANIMEAVNTGSKLLLIDEDKSATNFMIRDRVMKELIEKEPITPFTDRVNELHDRAGVSTILVIGGSGEYLTIANKIYMMQDYRIHDVTKRAKAICNQYNIHQEDILPSKWHYFRKLKKEGFTPYPDGSSLEELKVSDMGFIIIGDERVDVRMLHNIASIPQLTAIAFILRRLELENNSNFIDLKEEVDMLLKRIEEDGLDSVYSSYFTQCGRWMDLPRVYEILAVLYRMRYVSFVLDIGE
ncbi:MAG: ATPase of the class-like protein [Herbinix sp.]|nr:ATPase of the class-like protein [Herbinix sp.]